MKLLPVILLACGAIVLTGCAGTDSQFECDATTNDSCMTMDQANQKARSVTNSSAGKQAAAVLPALVNPPQHISVPAAAPGIIPIRVATPPTPARPYVPVKPFSRHPVSAASVPLTSSPATRCVSRACDAAGVGWVVRSSEIMATLWIAPWVDTADVLHQPGRVLFLVSDPQWQLSALME